MGPPTGLYSKSPPPPHPLPPQCFGVQVDLVAVETTELETKVHNPLGGAVLTAHRCRKVIESGEAGGGERKL